MTAAIECNLNERMASRIACLLGSTDYPAAGDPLPVGWHFPLVDCLVPRGLLRVDGYPGLGLPLEAHEFPRLLAAGRQIEVHGSIHVGAPLVRTSTVISEDRKIGSDGEMLLLTVRHEIGEAAANPSIVEHQTYIVTEGRYRPRVTAQRPGPADRLVQSVTPDATMLFQFSALSFNSHRIHLDCDYARDVEGYPDLVVNGGLTTLLMCESARNELTTPIRTLSVRNRAPLFCDRPIAFYFRKSVAGARILACDEAGGVAAEMEIKTDAF